MHDVVAEGATSVDDDQPSLSTGCELTAEPFERPFVNCKGLFLSSDDTATKLDYRYL